jgi:hypothetical protein
MASLTMRTVSAATTEAFSQPSARMRSTD